MKDVGGSSTAFIDDAWDGVVPEPCSMSYSYSYEDSFDCIFSQYSSCCEVFEAVADGDMTCAMWAVDFVAYDYCWAGDLTDQCYISQCGCPSVDFFFGEDWCTEDNAIINSDWCVRGLGRDVAALAVSSASHTPALPFHIPLWPTTGAASPRTTASVATASCASMTP